MSEKRIYGRAIQKHDVEANWLKATNFTPLQGEIIVYDADSTYPYQRFKIGDGKTLVNNLPFMLPSPTIEDAGKILKVNENGAYELVEVEDQGEPLEPVTNIVTQVASGKVYVRWTDPEDLFVEGTM